MLSFFPRGVLDEILNLIESVSGSFPSYPCLSCTVHTPTISILFIVFGRLVVFEFNGPLRQYFSLYRAVSQRQGDRRERIDERLVGWLVVLGLTAL